MKRGTVALIVGDRYGLADILRIKLERQGGEAVIVPQPDDPLNAGEWADHLDGVVQRLDRIDFVIGLMDDFQTLPFLEMNERDWDRIMFHNVKTPLIISRLTVPVMTTQGFGTMVFLSSPAARSGMAKASAYAASKGGLLGFVRSLALEVATSNIRVNLVSVTENDALHAENVAEVLLFLLDEQSSFMTGQEIRTSG